MSSLNKVLLIGRLGKDPEVRQTQTNESVASFSLATSETWTDKGGIRQERTTWHNVVAWGKLADLAKQYLSKGRQVYVEGRLQNREWEKDGQKHRTTEVIAGQLVFLGNKQDSANDGPITDNDIPF